MTAAAPTLTRQGNGLARIVLASLVGTTIEFYDFYIYGLAAALVLGPMFFPKAAPETQSLNAFLTFGVAFVARPVGFAAVRPFRRPDRAQGDARRLHAGDGAFDHPDRLSAGLRHARRPPPHGCWCCCASGRASGSAANGAARR